MILIAAQFTSKKETNDKIGMQFRYEFGLTEYKHFSILKRWTL
jgi:hypothetical protein